VSSTTEHRTLLFCDTRGTMDCPFAAVSPGPENIAELGFLTNLNFSGPKRIWRNLRKIFETVSRQISLL
jgi:hypothetical protein